MNNTSCLILAGGQSKRFGENKALYAFDGKSFLERILETALKVADDIIISVREIDNLDEFCAAAISILNKIYNNADFAINFEIKKHYNRRLIDIAIDVHNRDIDNKYINNIDIKKKYNNYTAENKNNYNLRKIKKNTKINEINQFNNNINLKIIADADNKNNKLVGPLKGIFSCFGYFKNDYVLLLECDAPFFSIDCANILINKAKSGDYNSYKSFDAVVPMWLDSTIEPLLACYSRKKTFDVLSMLNSYALELKSYNDFIYNDAINVSRFLNQVYYFSINDIIKENNQIKSEYFLNINNKNSLYDILKKRTIKTKLGISYPSTPSISSKNLLSVHGYETSEMFAKRLQGNNSISDDIAAGDRKSIIVVKRNNFFGLAGFNNNKKNIIRRAKPYGNLSNQLYYLKLYNKSSNINNNININDKIYLKKFLFFLNKEKKLYLNKKLFFIADKIQKAMDLYKNENKI
jgi:molybdopterin-guanine dinucleotide biosynthesis protein A